MKIWDSVYVCVLCLNTILGFQCRASTLPRTKTFKIHESRVGTPLRRNLLFTLLGEVAFFENLFFVNKIKPSTCLTVKTSLSRVWCTYQKFYMGTVSEGLVFRATVSDLGWPHKPKLVKP